VGRRRALSGGDRLGCDRTPQAGRDPARGRVPSTGCLTGSALRRLNQTAICARWGPDAGTSLLEDKRVAYCSRLDARKLKAGRYLFARHGGKVVFFARFITVLRTYAAIWRGESGRVQSRPADTDRK